MSIPTTPAVPLGPAHCPSCHRFIGPAMTCPYCGAEAEGRLPLRLGRWLALLLGTVGLALLYIAARQQTPEFIRIADIQPGMNFAQVQLRGTVHGAPAIYHVSNRVDYVSFTLNDGSGGLTVFASGPLAVRLTERNTLPAKGDQIQVRGALTLSRRGIMKLRLMSESQLQTYETQRRP